MVSARVNPTPAWHTARSGPSAPLPGGQLGSRGSAEAGDAQGKSPPPHPGPQGSPTLGSTCWASVQDSSIESHLYLSYCLGFTEAQVQTAPPPPGDRSRDGSEASTLQDHVPRDQVSVKTMPRESSGSSTSSQG